MVCVGGRSVFLCHCRAWAAEKRWTRGCAQLTFMAPSLTESYKATVHSFREKMLPFHFSAAPQICEVFKHHEHKEVTASV